jgi:ribonuclease Z
LKIVFLGTSGSMPTPERSSSAIAVKMGRSVVLLDCGEGTQRQMIAAHIGFSRVKTIFVTHLHGDHVLGIPGLLQSMTLQKREEQLNIFGPKGILTFLQGVSNSLGGPGFPVAVHEINEPGIVFLEKKVKVEACRADHRLEAWSYILRESPRPGKFHPDKARTLGVPEGILWKRLQEGEEVKVGDRIVRSLEVTDPPRKGRLIVYTGDTRPSENIVIQAIGADLLIHEATFGEELAERADEDGHSTADMATRRLFSKLPVKSFKIHRWQ